MGELTSVLEKSTSPRRWALERWLTVLGVGCTVLALAFSLGVNYERISTERAQREAAVAAVASAIDTHLIDSAGIRALYITKAEADARWQSLEKRLDNIEALLRQLIGRRNANGDRP